MNATTNTPHSFGPHGKASGGKGHPIMYGDPRSAHHFGDFPDGGGYPKRFLEFCFSEMARVSGREVDPAKVLHLCSGSVVSGITVDVRAERNPTIVADCRNVPLPDETFDFILADPPYSEQYADDLYGTKEHYPRPGQIMREACRLLRPGGLVGLLHFQVPMTRKPLRVVSVYGVTTGAGYAIRAWTLCQRVPTDPEILSENA